jgi:hypothetical protein
MFDGINGIDGISDRKTGQRLRKIVLDGINKIKMILKAASFFFSRSP